MGSLDKSGSLLLGTKIYINRYFATSLANSNMVFSCREGVSIKRWLYKNFAVELLGERAHVGHRTRFTDVH